MTIPVKIGPFGFRLNVPYLNGVYVAIDAIPDIYLVVDGPYCLVQKAEMQVAHNPASTLVSPAGVGRVVVTDIQTDTLVVANMATNRGVDIRTVLTEVANLPEAGMVLISSMDFHEITRAPLDLYRRQVAPACRAPIGIIEGRSLEDDWLEGYARTLDQVAQIIALPSPEPAPERVAIVGLLFDRAEGDHQGNLAELDRLVAALGLVLVSVWPSGVPTASLSAVQSAGTIVSLPYGRAAARTLAERLGATLVEVDLPLGPDATLDFLDALGNAVGRIAEARAFCSQEMDRIEAASSSLVHRHLVGRRAIVAGDPHVAAGLCNLLPTLGMEVASVIVQARAAALPSAQAERLRAYGAWFEPSMDERIVDGLALDRDVEADIVIAPTLVPIAPLRAAYLPFGYPNYLAHALLPQPFLGFKGTLWWIERLVSASLQAEGRASSTLSGGGAAHA